MTIVFSLICFSLLLAEQSLITKFFQPWIKAYDDIVDYINSMQWDSPEDINTYTVERQKEIPTRSNVPIQLLENLSLGIAFAFLTLIPIENLFNPSWVELLSMNSQHIGLISILVSWAGLLFLIWKWKGNGSMTFSQHAAQYKTSIWYYRIMWLIVLPPFLYFMIYEYSEKLHMGFAFDCLVYISVFLMFVAAMIPEVKGWQFHVHRFAAFVMAALFLPVLSIAVSSENISMFSRIITVVSMVYMVTSIISVWAATALKNKVQEHPRTLLSQAIYIALFNVSILITYYL